MSPSLLILVAVVLLLVQPVEAQARVYSPTLGRWAQRDPAGYRSGPSVYAFCVSRPLTSHDPDGRLISSGLLGGLVVQGPASSGAVTLTPGQDPGYLSECWADYQQCAADAGADPYRLAECKQKWADCARDNVPAIDHPDPVKDTSPECDDYGDERYADVSLTCFCKCAGNSDWSLNVRACLLRLRELGVDPFLAHITCYNIGDVQYGPRPWPTLLWCTFKCSVFF